MNTTAKTLIAGACAIGLAIPVSAPALAKGGAEVRQSGDCTGRTDWKLKAKARDGGIEIEFEVDSNRVGQRWTYTLKHNGSAFASGARRTQAPSGSFSVERRVSNLAGVDRFVGLAHNPRTGESCRGTLRF